ncbi:MAG TPA: site-2 protease family protein [Pirellulales bacterium]|jgi:regulator of sigma E protease|nr:site-2 protease family protein [Pirellulales bacterium]
MYLIAAVESGNSLLNSIWGWTEAALALGAVIFIHELGHFLVAKLCGVKCEKFYIGFDIGGWKIAHFQWGETEYGIGILPLGGYVKMLGQDDNPNNAEAERERALKKGTAAEGLQPGLSVAAPQFDPRSFIAQSVPERMAIISAGVIMNILFAFVLASWAYSIGVTYLVSEIKETFPGEGAWQAGLRPGDKVLQVGHVPGQQDNEQFDFDDLKQKIVFSDLDQGLDLKIRRVGVEEPFWITVKPDKQAAVKNGMPRLGIADSATNRLFEGEPAQPTSPADQPNGVQGGDTIVEVNDHPVHNFAEIETELAQHPSDPLDFVVLREPKSKAGAPSPAPGQGPSAQAERVKITIAPNPRRMLGLIMRMGKITAIEHGSPADKAGIKPGDFIVEIDGEPVNAPNTKWNPITLPEELRRRAAAGQKSIKIKVSRDRKEGQPEQLAFDVDLRNPTWFEGPHIKGAPMSAPAIGIAYRVMNIVQDVERKGPADASDDDAKRVLPNDTIEAAHFIISKEYEAKFKEVAKDDFKFSEDEPNWPIFITVLQQTPPDTKVELTIKRGEKELKVELEPALSQRWFNPERGLLFAPNTNKIVAQSFGEALDLGWHRTLRDMTQIVRTLKGLTSGQVSAKNLSGPIGIAAGANMFAREGFVPLLLFMCLISANLAVVNFLPIPVLDGGHMMFLLYEGIRGKPPNERVMAIMTYCGLAFILSLMIFVIGLDISRLFH